MALTNELLNANAATAALTDEQKTAIVEMSRNDEQAVIGQKTGEIYGGLDADILAASGIAKNGTEKTYDYAKLSANIKKNGLKTSWGETFFDNGNIKTPIKYVFYQYQDGDFVVQ